MKVELMEDQVKQALTEIIDPETGLSIMRMDLIHNLSVTEDGGEPRVSSILTRVSHGGTHWPIR